MKKTVVRDNIMVPSLCGGLLSATNFAQSEWEKCTLILLRKVLLIPMNIETNKMFNVLYVCYNSFKFCFADDVCCTFTCTLFLLGYLCFPCVCLCTAFKQVPSPPSNA
jgi:hypothetical protein